MKHFCSHKRFMWNAQSCRKENTDLKAKKSLDLRSVENNGVYFNEKIVVKSK